MQGHHPMTDGSQPVQVISAQTLGPAQTSGLSVDLVIIDEAHQKHKVVLLWLERSGQTDLRVTSSA